MRRYGGSLPVTPRTATTAKLRSIARAVLAKGTMTVHYLNMMDWLKTNLDEFQESEPGQRFQDRYHRRRENEKGHVALRVFNIIFGSVLALGSLALAPLPGPGILTVFLGLAIVAGELLYAARFLDWAEVTLRRFGRFVRGMWRSSMGGKALVILGATVLAAGLGYAVYYFLFA